MTQLLTAERQEKSSQVGDLDAPRMTLLGSLDDGQGSDGLQLDAERPEPFLAIIYNGI